TVATSAPVSGRRAAKSTNLSRDKLDFACVLVVLIAPLKARPRGSPARVHECAPVQLVRRVLVMGAAKQADGVHVVQVGAGETFDVIEFQTPSLTAAMAAVIDERAAAAVPLVDGALDRVRHVARRGVPIRDSVAEQVLC